MAQITGFLGPPSPDFVQRSETTSQCFSPDGKPPQLTSRFVLIQTCTGKWIADKHAEIPTTTLEEVEEQLEGSEKDSFLRFIRSMLRWRPEERKTAKELLEDLWLNEE